MQNRRTNNNTSLYKAVVKTKITHVNDLAQCLGYFKCELTLQSYRVWVNSWDLLDSKARPGRYFLVRNLVAYLSACLSVYLTIYLSIISVYFLSDRLKRERGESHLAGMCFITGNFGIFVSSTYWLLTQVTKVKCKTSYSGSG